MLTAQSWRIVGVSVEGTCHQKSQTGCQDAYEYRQMAPLPRQTHTSNPRGFPSSMLIMLLIGSPIICAIAAVLLYYLEVVIRALLHTR
jgi:hypothetical protein